MHVDLVVHFVVVPLFNSFTPGLSAITIFDGDTMFLGPVVTFMSPDSVVATNLWSRSLNASSFVKDMGLVVAHTTPHGNVVTPVVSVFIYVSLICLCCYQWDSDSPRRRDGLGTPLPRPEL